MRKKPDANLEGRDAVSFTQFTVFGQVNPTVIFPAFIAQTKLQEAVLGIEFWEKVASERSRQIQGGRRFLSSRDLYNQLQAWKVQHIHGEMAFLREEQEAKEQKELARAQRELERLGEMDQWTAIHDESCGGALFYHNKRTGVSQFECPEGYNR